MLVREIDVLPDDLPLLPWSEEEMRKVPPVERDIFVRRSEHVWVLMDEDHHTLAVVGVIRPSASSIPELWMLLCTGFKANLRRNLEELKIQMLDVLFKEYEWVKVRIDAENPAGTKLAQFFGFTEYERDASSGREYIYLEVKRGIRGGLSPNTDRS